MSIQYAVVLAIASPSHTSGLTKMRPHAMLPALGKPLVVRVMNQLLDAGIKKFIVVLGVNEGSVASYLKTNWVPNVELEFVLKSDYESLSSTLAQVAQKLSQPFLIVTYNIFAQPQFVPTIINLARHNPEYLILAGTNSTLSQSTHNGFAIVDGTNVVAISSYAPDDLQSSYLIANIAICGHHFINFLAKFPKKKSTGSLHQQLIDILHIYAESQDQKIMLGRTSWILQVNNDSDLALLNNQYLEEGRDTHILTELPASVQIHYPVRIDPGVTIGHDAEIGPYVYLETGASIGNRARVRRSIVLENAIVPPQSQINETIVAPNRLIPIQLN